LDDIDPDYVFMACTDLLTELQKPGFTLDSDSLRQMTRKMLERIQHSSQEVQGLVVRKYITVV